MQTKILKSTTPEPNELPQRPFPREEACLNVIA